MTHAFEKKSSQMESSYHGSCTSKKSS